MLFFASALVAAGLWGAHRRTLTRFERWALPLLLVAAFAALRNGVWFELAAAVSLPRLLDAARPPRLEPPRRSARQLARRVAALLVVGVVLASSSRGPRVARERPLARRSRRRRGRRRQRRHRACRRRACRLASLAAAVTCRPDRLRRPVRAVRRARAPAAEAARGCVAPGLAALRLAGARRHVRRAARREGRAA